MEFDKDLISEPRIREYLRKKKIYAENNITPDIPLELEFSITPSDFKRLVKTGLLTTTNKYFPKTPFRNVEPKIQYQQQMHYIAPDGKSALMPHNPDMTKVIQYTDDQTEVPAFLSTMIDKHKSGRTYDVVQVDNEPNKCVQTIRDQYLAKKPRDTEKMVDLQLGMPIRTRKSYGFDDPFEHYFDYVDDDKQQPEHTVMDFPRGGTSARLENKTSRTRDVDWI
jgi:hypothetical protein